MPEVVVDASVVAKWQLADEEFIVEAERLRSLIYKGALELVVPWFWHYESASIFSKAVHNRRLPEEKAVLAIQIVSLLPARVVPPPQPLRAFASARRFNRGVIDCFYLALAEERNCDFWTDDRKLARAVGAQYPFVRWIGEYPDPSLPASR